MRQHERREYVTAEIFEELVALKADLRVAAKQWKKRCPFTGRLYRESATNLVTKSESI